MNTDSIQLNLVVLRSADIDAAVAFYRALGITLANEKHGNGPEHFAAQLGTIILEIYPSASTSTAGLRLGFCVTGIEERLAAALAAGGKLLQALHQSPWGRRAVIADPDGHQVELVAA